MFYNISPNSVVISRTDTFALKSRRYESSDILTLTVVMSRKKVKYARNTICDSCSLKSRRYEFSDISTHVVKSLKAVK